MEVLTLCVNRGGYRHGRRVAQFIAEWELAVRSIGRNITAEEFGAWWKDSPATAYRRLAEFRQLFPELGQHGKPDDLMGPLLTQLMAASFGQEVGDVPLVVPT
jgi:hypothetical protein